MKTSYRPHFESCRNIVRQLNPSSKSCKRRLTRWRPSWKSLTRTRRSDPTSSTPSWSMMDWLIAGTTIRLFTIGFSSPGGSSTIRRSPSRAKRQSWRRPLAEMGLRLGTTWSTSTSILLIRSTGLSSRSSLNSLPPNSIFPRRSYKKSKWRTMSLISRCRLR